MHLCEEHTAELHKAVADRGLDVMVVPLDNAMRIMAPSELGIDSQELPVKANGIPECPICFLINNCGCGEPDCGFKSVIPFIAERMLALYPESSMPTDLKYDN